MAKRGIRVKDLARELGVTSRELLNRCRAEGIPVQNSITKLGHNVEQLVRTWFFTGSTHGPEDADRA